MLDDIPMGSGDTINHHAHGATIPDLKFDALDAARAQFGPRAVLRIMGMAEITSYKQGLSTYVQVVCVSVPESGLTELTNVVDEHDLAWTPDSSDACWTDADEIPVESVPVQLDDLYDGLPDDQADGE